MNDYVNGGQPLVGEIRIFAGNTEPAGWAFCDGRLLSIDAYTVLFSIIGTTYGGDGLTNFGLPDMRGRVPIGQGAGPGLSNRTLGHHPGAENVSLSPAQLPAHAHSIQATNSIGNQASPGANAFAAPPSNESIYRSSPGPLVSMGPTTGITGSCAPLPTLQPSLVLNFIIALEGLDPGGRLMRTAADSNPPSV